MRPKSGAGLTGGLTNGEPLAGDHRAIRPTVDHQPVCRSCGAGRCATPGAGGVAVCLRCILLTPPGRSTCSGCSACSGKFVHHTWVDLKHHYCSDEDAQDLRNLCPQGCGYSCAAGRRGAERAVIRESPSKKVISYALAYINPLIFSGDNGRVLGHDNSHGYSRTQPREGSQGPQRASRHREDEAARQVQA